MQLDAIRRCQLAMVATWVAVEIGDDAASETSREFDDAFAALIEAPVTSVEEAALRLRCLAQVGEYFDGCTSMAQDIYGALQVIAAGLQSSAGRMV
jgi:hypothetical protein